MRFEVKARYPASSGVVIKMFADKDFHTRKLEALGLRKYQVLKHESTDAEFSIRIERKVPMAPPGLISKLVPAEASVTSEERWNLAKKTGRIKVEPAGIPVEITGTASLADAGQECVITYVWEAKARVPLVGGALEKFIASDMEKKMVDETKAAITLLGPYR
jgi:hypothetical protein